jgi:XTP/dITP diphosphohydrolase
LPLVLASTNKGKLKEFDDLFQRTFNAPRPRILPISQFAERFNVDETGNTFAENARIKSEAAMKLSGLPSLGDDSGLCVKALGGEPGIRSARWLGDAASDQDRNLGLLDRLNGVSEEQRTAYFECALHVAFPDGTGVRATGRCYGRIGFEEVGTDGFGYDAVFLVGNTGANDISHRMLAVRELKNELLALQCGLLI